MGESIVIPPEARCLTCDYRLRDLPEPVCPECGRAFDPADASTFDTRPHGWRRRRWIKRGAVALAIILLAFALFPRGLVRSNMSFTCAQCGAQSTVKRWEPRSPRWIPLRYPGFHWTSAPASTPAPTDCEEHGYDVSVRFDLYIGGWGSGTGRHKPGEVVTFNDQPATPETAPRVLKALTDPSNMGISVGSVPASGRPDEGQEEHVGRPPQPDGPSP